MEVPTSNPGFVGIFSKYKKLFYEKEHFDVTTIYYAWVYYLNTL